MENCVWQDARCATPSKLGANLFQTFWQSRPSITVAWEWKNGAWCAANRGPGVYYGRWFKVTWYLFRVKTSGFAGSRVTFIQNLKTFNHEAVNMLQVEEWMRIENWSFSRWDDDLMTYDSGMLVRTKVTALSDMQSHWRSNITQILPIKRVPKISDHAAKDVPKAAKK